MPTVDPTIRSSRLGVTVLALFDLYTAADLPVHPTSGKPPQVFLGHDPHNVAEYVTVIVNPEQTFNEWVHASPATRGETFSVDVGIRSIAPAAFDQRRAWERLTAIVDAVEGALYDVQSGRPINLGLSNVSAVQRAAALDQALIPSDSGSWSGTAVVRVEFEAFI